MGRLLRGVEGAERERVNTAVDARGRREKRASAVVEKTIPTLQTSCVA